MASCGFSNDIQQQLHRDFNSAPNPIQTWADSVSVCRIDLDSLQSGRKVSVSILEDMDQESLGRLITFPFVPGETYDPADRYPFWNLPTTVEWFTRRGYTLYESTGNGISRPALPFEPKNEANHPCASYDTDVYHYSTTTPAEHLLAKDYSGKVVYAQDTFNRHVAIKLVRADTDEYRVMHFLSEQSMKTLEQNCVIPVFELLPTQGFWFAVMPRWGDQVYNPPFYRLSDAVDVMHSMLKGLAFLHNNNISHGDVELRNVLVNHFSDDRTAGYNITRKKLREARRLSYALFDFDFSTMFPRDADRSKCRLPYQRSWGTFNVTGDTAVGEYDYDPFALDVGGLGATFCDNYTSLIPLLPGLAPLFDMMATWDVGHRFTATEALEFFESHVSDLSEAQLETPIDEQLTVYLGSDPWKVLAPDFVEKWKMYKSLPQPWSRRLLRWITRRRWMCHIVPWTRWLCFQAFCALPTRIYRWSSRSVLPPYYFLPPYTLWRR